MLQKSGLLEKRTVCASLSVTGHNSNTLFWYQCVNEFTKQTFMTLQILKQLHLCDKHIALV